MFEKLLQTNVSSVFNVGQAVARHMIKRQSGNAIAPGYFDTPLNAALVADADFTAWVAKSTPTGRWGQLHELVGACIFLSSPASSFVNGHTLFVDGGMSVCL